MKTATLFLTSLALFSFITAPNRAASITVTTHTGAAIQSAINSVAGSTEGGVVYLEAATYTLTSSLTYPGSPTNRNIRIIGQGAGSTVLLCQMTGGYAFDFSLASQADHLEIRNLTLQADTSGVPGAAYIHYDVTDDLTDVLRHEYVGPMVANVSVTSPDATHYFSNGLKFKYAWNTRIMNCTLVGKPSGYSGYGVEFTTRSSNSLIQDCTITDWETGLRFDEPPSSTYQPIEGIYLVSSTVSAVKYGVYYEPSTDYNVGGIAIHECNISAPPDNSIGVYLRGSWLSVIRDNNISVGSSSSTYNCFSILTRGPYNLVAGNTCSGNSKGGGIVLLGNSYSFSGIPSDSRGNLVAANSLSDIFGAPIWTQEGPGSPTTTGAASYNKIVNNTLPSGTTVYESGGCQGNYINDN